MKVKLEEIIEAMEFTGMETEYYYDTKNERILMLFDGMVDGVFSKLTGTRVFSCSEMIVGNKKVQSMSTQSYEYSDEKN